MTELHPDLRDESDDIFVELSRLPAEIPENLRAIHADLIVRMRNEARAVSMSTIQRLLMERIAYFYIAMKWRETDAETPLSLKEQKEMLDFWIKMTNEFNKLLNATESKSRSTLLAEVELILRESAKKLEDPEKRRELTNYWSAEFARIDA